MRLARIIHILEASGLSKILGKKKTHHSVILTRPDAIRK